MKHPGRTFVRQCGKCLACKGSCETAQRDPSVWCNVCNGKKLGENTQNKSCKKEQSVRSQKLMQSQGRSLIHRKEHKRMHQKGNQNSLQMKSTSPKSLVQQIVKQMRMEILIHQKLNTEDA